MKTFEKIKSFIGFWYAVICVTTITGLIVLLFLFGGRVDIEIYWDTLTKLF